MMGGLIKRMPQTSMLFFDRLHESISSLPLLTALFLNWLAFQTALQVDVLENGVLRQLDTSCALLD